MRESTLRKHAECRCGGDGGDTTRSEASQGFAPTISILIELVEAAQADYAGANGTGLATALPDSPRPCTPSWLDKLDTSD